VAYAAAACALKGRGDRSQSAREATWARLYTHVACGRTHVAEIRLFPLVSEAKIEATFGGIARDRPREPATPS